METRKPAPVKPGPMVAPSPSVTEQGFLDGLLGKEVLLFWRHTQDPDRVSLLGVNKYTLICRFQNGKEKLVFKDTIRTIEAG